MDYGATVLGIDVPDIPGNVRDVVLGFDKLEDYLTTPPALARPSAPWQTAPQAPRSPSPARLAHAGQRRRQQPAQRS
ncbi:MAG: hypothetical protein ACLU37_11440 [Collinsella sp.]